MSNQIKYEYVKEHWQLRDGIVYSKRTDQPVAFASKNKDGRHFQNTKINGKYYSIFIHEAIFVLFHDRPIAEGKEIHHKDGNPANNAIDNLIELTPTQHKRIHAYQCDAPLRAIDLHKGAWRFRFFDDNGIYRGRRFNNLNEAMAFRDEIEHPRRQELRALGLNCKRVSSGEKSRATKASKFYFSRCYAKTSKYKAS